MILFDRQAKLDIYTRNKKIEVVDKTMMFEITAHRRRTPNESKIRVLNLDPSIQALLEDEAEYLEFFAGYKGSPLGRIHKGYVKEVESSLRDEDWITVIESSDTGKDKAYTHSIISETFSAGTPVVDVFNKLASLMNMSVILDYDKTEILLTSETYMGNVRYALDDISKDYGYSWSIQYGVLEIVKKGKAPVRDSKVIEISKDILLGPPKVTKKGVELPIMLVPGLIPSRIVSVPKTSTNDAATLIIDSIKYEGSTTEGAYKAQVIAWREI